MNKINIPKILQRNTIKFCLLKKKDKVPFEMNWQNEGYSYDDPKLLDHLKKGNNYGVLCGVDKLAVIDVENHSEELKQAVEEKLPKTFIVQTGSGGFHYYFFIEGLDKKIVMTNKEGHWGEVQFTGTQVVGASCLHPNGKEYKQINNELIARIELEELMNVIKPFTNTRDLTPSNKKDTEEWAFLIEPTIQKWKEGERQEIALNLSGYLRKNKGLGIDKVKAIITYICEQTQDNELNMRLRAVDETFKKDETEIKGISGLDYLKDVKEEIKFDVYSDADLIDYEPPEMEWLIHNEIPKGEIGILAAKRGKRKTWFALRQAISLASGKECFGDEVPEKKKVLFVDEESGKPTLAKRVKKLKKGLGIKEALDIKFLSFEDLKLNKIEHPKYEAFEKLLLDFMPDLIIIDCLQRVVSIEVDKDNTSLSEFFTGVVRKLTKKIGCSWLFIHHMRKGSTNQKPDDPLDEIRGGSELVNYCRYILMCDDVKQKDEKGNELLTLEVLKMSNVSIPEPKAIGFLDDGLGIQMNYLGDPEEILNPKVKVARAIKEYLMKHNIYREFRTKEINEAAEEIGFRKTFLSSGLKHLWDTGILVKEKKGVWRFSTDENEEEEIPEEDKL